MEAGVASRFGHNVFGQMVVGKPDMLASATASVSASASATASESASAFLAEPKRTRRHQLMKKEGKNLSLGGLAGKKSKRFVIKLRKAIVKLNFCE